MLINHKVKEEYLKVKESNKNFRIIISWLGFKNISLPITIEKRSYGKSYFSFFQLLRLAINIFSSFSIMPIKLVGYIGLIMSFLSFLAIILLLINNITNFLSVSWQTQIIILSIFLNGLIMTSIGILGIYMSKILNNTNDRPNYIIEKKTK